MRGGDWRSNRCNHLYLCEFTILYTCVRVLSRSLSRTARFRQLWLDLTCIHILCASCCCLLPTGHSRSPELVDLTRNYPTPSILAYCRARGPYPWSVNLTRVYCALSAIAYCRLHVKHQTTNNYPSLRLAYGYSPLVGRSYFCVARPTIVLPVLSDAPRGEK